jgi:hypothetical protein
MKLSRVAPIVLAALLAACADTTAPTASSSLRPSERPAALLSADEFTRTILDTTDARGTQTMIAEYAAGIDLDNRDAAPIGSVIIKTVVPVLTAGSSKTPCITSTVLSTETVAGWTASVKKPGGCDKQIEVQFENKSTKQRADFSFLYIFGKTRIDFGAID